MEDDYDGQVARLNELLPHLPEMVAAEAQAQLPLQQRSIAVLHYHRGLVYERLGRQDEADADYRRVRELGFEPGDDLF